MIALLGGLLGFLTSVFPDIFKIFKARQDNAQELAILQLQIQAQKDGVQQHLEEVGLAAEQAIYVAAHAPQQLIGIPWIDGLNASVRPIVAYAFFLLYAGVKIMAFVHLHQSGLPWQYDALWSEEDMGIFSGILAYFYGMRSSQAKNATH